MRCNNCGTECADKAAFCDWCGERLHAESHFNKCITKDYSFVNALEDYFKYAFCFEGRTRRKAFWCACVWNFIFAFAIYLTGIIVSRDLQFALEVAFYAGIFIPNISLAFRRMHDIGKSAYWLFIGFIPLIGHIALAVLFAIDGDKQKNKYGPSPKYSIE